MADVSKITTPDGTAYDIKDTNARGNVPHYGTCPTAAGTAEKVVTVDNAFKLVVGVIIGVKFTNTNTASNVTLNVNSTGAKSIYYNNAVYTSTSNAVCGYAKRVNYYMYDGTYWVFLSNGIVDSNTNNAVTQTISSTTNADYRVLFSATADDTTRTEGARKDTNFKYNPSTDNLTVGKLNGVSVGSSALTTSTKTITGAINELLTLIGGVAVKDVTSEITWATNVGLVEKSCLAVGAVRIASFQGTTSETASKTLNIATLPAGHRTTQTRIYGVVLGSSDSIRVCSMNSSAQANNYDIIQIKGTNLNWYAGTMIWIANV